MKKGIDISYWQENVNFAEVKRDRIDFVILRSSYRTTTDQRFFEYANSCKSYKIPVLGVYHFIYARNKTEALKEAEYCVEQVKKAGLGKDTIIFADFEYDTVKNAATYAIKLGPKECNEFTRVFCEYVESQGYKAGIYSNVDYYKNWYEKDLINKYYFWLADYSGGPDYKCYIQQFTSSGKVAGINGRVDMNYLYGEEVPEVSRSRQAVVDLVNSWLGRKESDGTHKYIIDIYNSYTGGLPRGIKMAYNWAWCACTWSALAIKLGYTDIMPLEISCGELVENAKKMGCWQEKDNFVAKPGDAILYDWEDSGAGDNIGWPDHIGVITEVHPEAGYYVVTEGNYGDAVKKRTISINGRYIRGFITPKYDENDVKPSHQDSGKDLKTIAREVIAGTWGNGDNRRKALERAGYDYAKVQKEVNNILNGDAKIPSTSVQNQNQPFNKKVVATCDAEKFDKTLAGTYKTSADLYCRNDAGSNKKALCLIPRGTEVKNYGYYTISNGTKWLYIQFVIDRVQYTGFSSINYLKKQ